MPSLWSCHCQDSQDWAGGQTEMKVPEMECWKHVQIMSHSCSSGSPGYLCLRSKCCHGSVPDTCVERAMDCVLVAEQIGG